MSDVLIVGGGLAGLTAARTLLASGRSIAIVDKGFRVGGRLATRRIDDARVDHGAQFFTVRGDTFRAFVDSALDAGIVEEWCQGFGEADGYPRYYCPEGMNSLARWMADDIQRAGGDIHTSSRVRSISASAGWSAMLDSGHTIDAPHVIVTSPVPQSLALLDAGEISLDPLIDAGLRKIAYKPTLALLVTVEGDAAVPAPGGVQQTEDDLFTFIADNKQKGVSATTALTFHVNGSVTAARWDDEPDVVVDDLLEQARPWLGSSVVRSAQLMKWKYAGPLVPHADACVMARSSPGRLVLAGDAFAGPKVEGAFNSGRAAGLSVAS